MLNLIYIGLIFVSMASSIIYVKYRGGLSYKILSLFLGITFFNEVTCYFLLKSHMNNLPLYNAYYYIRPVFIALLYKNLFITHIGFRKYTNAFLIVFLTIILPINIFYYGFYMNLHAIAYAIGNLFIITCCLYYFYWSYKDDTVMKPFVQPFFFTSSAFLIFTLILFPFNTLHNLLLKITPHLLDYRQLIARVLSIFLYSLITLDIYLEWKRKKLSY